MSTGVLISPVRQYIKGGSGGWLALRPEINVDEIKKQAVPDQVQVGVFFGYSMPIYVADPDNHEEVYFKQTVPLRWNGRSDIIIHLNVALAAAETVGDYFRFQLSWEHLIDGQPIPATSNDVTAEHIVLAGRNAQYDEYELDFVIDYDIDGVGNEILSHELLAARLRRVDATDPDIAGEVIVLDWHTHFRADKMFGELP